MKPLDELSNDDIITGLLIEEIRRLDGALFNEAKTRNALAEKYETLLAEKRELEGQNTTLKAEVARLRIVADSTRVGPVQVAKLQEPPGESYFLRVP